jgi:hypothetical protein
VLVVAARCRRARQLIDTAVADADPVDEWAAVYAALWAGRHQLGCDLDQTAAPPSTPAPWGLARVEQASPGLPFPVIGWLARGEFTRAMADIRDSCPLDDWPRLHAELHTTLDSIWCLSTARTHRPREAERQRPRDNQQRLEVLLATARQHFDRPGRRMGGVPREAVARSRHRHRHRRRPGLTRRTSTAEPQGGRGVYV